MRTLLVILFTAITLPLSAQEARTARVIKKPEVAVPTPEPKPGLFDRLWRKSTPVPVPTPAPVEQPKPKPKPRPKAQPAPVEGAEPPAVVEQPPKPAKIATPDAKPVEPPATTEKPKPVEAPVVSEPPKPAEAPVVSEPPKPVEKPATADATPPPPAETAKPKAGKGKPVPAKIAQPEKPDLSKLDEPARYQAAKEIALKDEALLALKTKADSTTDTDEAKRASLAYNRALFRKIRDTEPSLDAYVDRLEQAVLKRLK